MTEQEIITEQRNSGNQKVFLQRVGTFYHAYDAGAFALARLTGYKVKRRKRRSGELLVAGFPATSLPKVRERAAAAGVHISHIVQGDDSVFLLSGADATPDNSLITPENNLLSSYDKNSLLSELLEIRRELLGINLGELTPQEVVLGVRNLQIKCLAHIKI